ncbi:MAG TPA: prevent-host-death family protein [Thermoanaerobaculia bacterium]
MSASVGVRELRQYLTRYLRRVANGETLQVLDRGKPVALLAPLPEHQDVVDRLIAAGRMKPARLDLADLEYPPETATSISVSEALQELRDEDRDAR